MSKVKRFSLEERYGYQNRKVIYDKNYDNDIELNNIYPIIDLFNQLDEQITDLQHKLKVSKQNYKKLEEENKKLKDFTENTENLIDKLTEDSVFASTQLAISELEKIKEKFTSEKWDLYDTPDLLEQVCELRNNQIKYIDNQIKELGGEKNE